MSPTTDDKSTLWGLGMLAVAVILWGVNWPIMKMGLAYISPFWFSVIRMGLAALTLFAALRVFGGITLPPRRDWPVILSVGILQVGLSMGLIYLALQYVEPGRSAVLTYTMPVWIAPLAFLFLGERLKPVKILALFAGIAGIAVLFNPLTFDWADGDYLFGNMLLLLAAFLWAIAIVHVRGHKWKGSTLSLLPWQMVVATVTLLPIALIMEGPPRMDMGWPLATILLYNGPVASALGFFAFMSAARALPANTTAMTSLAVPVVGLVSSAVVLGEVLTVDVLAGLGLIAAGILLSVRKA